MDWQKDPFGYEEHEARLEREADARDPEARRSRALPSTPLSRARAAVRVLLPGAEWAAGQKLTTQAAIAKAEMAISAGNAVLREDP